MCKGEKMNRNRMMDAIKELLFPSNICLICGKRGVEDGICENCRSKPWLKKYHICTSCAAFVEEGLEHCGNCRDGMRFCFDDVIAFAPYETELRKAILQLKFHNRKGLVRPMGKLLAAKIADSFDLTAIDALVPVPMYEKNRKERGYNQAALLAEQIGEILSIPVWEDAIIRSKETKKQSKLGRRERFLNLKDAMSVGTRDLTGKHVLLIDDIFTTGATASACAFVLKKAGAEKVSVAALAATVWRVS